MIIQDIHQELSHWLKDMDFLDIERKFIKKLIKDYVAGSGLITPQSVEEFNQRLFQLEIDIHCLRDDIITSQTKADLIIKKMVTGGRSVLMEQHRALKLRYDGLFASFKQFKQDLFGITSWIIEEEAID